MLFEITHRSEFTYSGPVFLEPHLLRLRPRCDGTQRLREFRLHIEPEPAGISELVDLDGNPTLRFWFTGQTERMVIDTYLEVETLRTNPWDFLPIREFEQLPLRYPEPMAQYLLPYRVPTATSEPVSRLAENAAREVGANTTRFLSTLCSTIHDRCTPIYREGGWPLAPEETLTRKEGSCRDLTVLFMDAARWMGLAARFVSGYQAGDPSIEERDLHAWAEVYVPGAGWRGYDPTHGLAVADRHVALAAGATPPDAAPTVGTYRGNGITSDLKVSVRIALNED